MGGERKATTSGLMDGKMTISCRVCFGSSRPTVCNKYFIKNVSATNFMAGGVGDLKNQVASKNKGLMWEKWQKQHRFVYNPHTLHRRLHTVRFSIVTNVVPGDLCVFLQEFVEKTVGKFGVNSLHVGERGCGVGRSWREGGGGVWSGI